MNTVERVVYESNYKLPFTDSGLLIEFQRCLMVIGIQTHGLPGQK